jgi:phytoene dehydrogenase-like protein
MYHLMTHVDMNVGVFYPMGGFYKIIEAVERLAKKHGAVIHTNSKVTKIVTSASPNELDMIGEIPVETKGKPHVTGVMVGDVFYPADVVVGNADLHHIETQLLEPENQTLPEKWWENKVPGPSAMLLFLIMSATYDETAFSMSCEVRKIATLIILANSIPWN